MKLAVEANGKLEMQRANSGRTNLEMITKNLHAYYETDRKTASRFPGLRGSYFFPSERGRSLRIREAPNDLDEKDRCTQVKQTKKFLYL